MRLNLNDIVERPGARKAFQFSLDLQDMSFLQICQLNGPFPVEGEAVNAAGALGLTGTIQVSMVCICDRCMQTIPVEKALPVTAYLTEAATEEENPDLFLLENGEVDLDDVFTTAFVLHLDSKVICRDDCQGLCTACGANLNDGPCACKPEIDSRLAALQQLLEDQD